jgi:putative methyltransferase (TIGR04325 family)
LFYSYQPRLAFPADLLWQILEISAVRTIGEKLAASRREPRIRYVDNLQCGKGSDLFLASGSLHYFEQALHEILHDLGTLPPHVIVNRAPFSDGDDLITVQDNRTFLVPCKLHSRTKLVNGMKSLGYELVAVFERSLIVPMYPDISAHNYSGFYFRRVA